MATRTTHHRRIATGVLATGLLLAPLTGCGGTADTDAAPEVTATESAPAEGTGDPTDTAEPEDTTGPEDTAAATGTDGDTDASVDCAGTSCSVTLSGNGAQTEVLGTPISLGAVESGRASIQVGDQEIGCSQGESVSAGPLSIECTTVTEDSVTMTASLG